VCHGQSPLTHNGGVPEVLALGAHAQHEPARVRLRGFVLLEHQVERPALASKGGQTLEGFLGCPDSCHLLVGLMFAAEQKRKHGATS
jgi:hypothetical protein